MKGPYVAMMNAMAVFEMLTNTLYAAHTAVVTAEPLDVARVKAWTREMLLLKGKIEEYQEGQDEGI